MTEERKLRLVHSALPTDDGAAPRAGAAGQDDPHPDAPVTDEEQALAEELRQALERGDEPVSSSLRAAWQPPELALRDHDALLARALGAVDAPSTNAEERAAALLRDALEPSGSAARTAARLALEGSHEEALADLARALRSAHRPAALEPARNEALVARALERRPRRAATRRLVPVTMSALAAVAALAAGVVFSFRAKDSTPAASAPAAQMARANLSLIRVRSTDDLFDPAAPFPREGGESARIDRIAMARAADLRANRFASWGVR
jgi:hypothetical protein